MAVHKMRHSLTCFLSQVDLLQVTIATRELRDKLSEVGKELDGLQYVFKETCKKIALVNISQTPRSQLPRQLDPHGNMAQTALQQAKRWHSTGKDHESRGVLKGLDLSKVTDLPSETREIDYTKVSWVANKRFEISKFKFKFPRARTYELIRARSRLYRSQNLQVNTRWKALAEIYTMHSFAPLSNLKIFVKNR